MSSQKDSRGTFFYTAVLVAVLLWAPLHNGGATHLGWTLSRLFLLEAVLVALWRSIRRGDIEFTKSFIIPCAVTLALILIIEALRADYSYAATQWVMSYAAMAALFFLAAHVARSSRRRWIENTLIISGMAEACWGIGQYLWGGAARAEGSFFNPSFFGGYLAAISAFTVARLIFLEKEKLFSSLYVPLYAICWISIVLGVLVSGSRGAVFALLVGFTIVVWSRVGRKVLPVILALILLVLLVPNPFQKRIKNLTDTDIYAWSRIGIWRSSGAMIADNPLGIGPGMYKYYSQRYAFPVKEAYARYGKVANKAHGSYLDLAAELTIPSALIVIGMACYLLLAGIRYSRRSKDFEAAAWSGALAAVMAHALVDSVHKSPPIAFLGAASAGVIWATWSAGSEVIKLRVKPWIRWAIPLIAALMIWTIIAPAAAYYANKTARESNIEEAGMWHDLATALAPGNASYWYSRSRWEKAMWERSGEAQQLQQTTKFLLYAQDINPLEDKYLAAIADLLAMVGETSEDRKEDALKAATNAYELASKLAPKNPFYHTRRGDLLLRLNMQKKAIEAFRKALEIEPNYLEARRRLASALAKAGDTNEAAQQYSILLEKAVQTPAELRSRYERELAGLDIDAAEAEAARIVELLKPDGFTD